jgi:Na+/H+ antiporter NhaC
MVATIILKQIPPMAIILVLILKGIKAIQPEFKGFVTFSLMDHNVTVLQGSHKYNPLAGVASTGPSLANSGQNCENKVKRIFCNPILDQ